MYNIISYYNAGVFTLKNPSFLFLMYLGATLYTAALIALLFFMFCAVRYFFQFHIAAKMDAKYEWSMRKYFPEYLRPLHLGIIIFLLFVSAFVFMIWGTVGIKQPYSSSPIWSGVVQSGKYKGAQWAKIQTDSAWGLIKFVFSSLVKPTYSYKRGSNTIDIKFLWDIITFGFVAGLAVLFSIYAIICMTFINQAKRRETADFDAYIALAKEREKLITLAMRVMAAEEVILTQEVFDAVTKAIYRPAHSLAIRDNASLPYLISNFPNTIFLKRDLETVSATQNFGIPLSGRIRNRIYTTNNFAEYDDQDVLDFLYYQGVTTIEYREDETSVLYLAETRTQNIQTRTQLIDVAFKTKSLFSKSDERVVKVLVEAYSGRFNDIMEKGKEVFNANNWYVKEIDKLVEKNPEHSSVKKSFTGNRMEVFQAQEKLNPMFKKLKVNQTTYKLDDCTKLKGMTAIRYLQMINHPKGNDFLKKIDENVNKILAIYQSTYFQHTIKTKKYQEWYERVEKGIIYFQEIE